LRRLSLRARLLVGLVALVAIGLGAAAVVTYEEQRSFLLTRLDQQVANSRLPVSVTLGLVHPGVPNSRRAGPGPGPAPSTFQTSGTYAVLLDSSGKLIKTKAFTPYGAATPSPPALPAKLPISQFRSKRLRLFTVNSKSGSALRYRAAALSVPGGRTLVMQYRCTKSIRRFSG
jgi:two-component system, OmpR family, sensor kinase